MALNTIFENNCTITIFENRYDLLESDSILATKTVVTTFRAYLHRVGVPWGYQETKREGVRLQENWLKGWPDEDDRLATLGLKNGDEVSIEFDDGVVTKGHIQQRTGAPPWILKKTQGVNEELIIKISSQTGIS